MRFALFTKSQKTLWQGIIICLVALTSLATPSIGLSLSDAEEEEEYNAATNNKPTAYPLEAIEVRGSTRLTSEQISEQLNLKLGTPLTDALVASIRQKLLGLGVFRSVLPSLAKGSKSGTAKLIVLVEDDETVLGPWAIGGRVAVTLGEAQAANASLNSPPLGYQLDLVSRNLFGALHRGRIHTDIDGEGVIREGGLAYGLPRWTIEGANFDAEISIVDPSRRYLNTMGFGAKAQAIWTQSLAAYQEMFYGPAIYINDGTQYRFPEFPESVAGAKVGYIYESRFMGFYPTAGHRLSAALVAAPLQFPESIVELAAAKTFSFGGNLIFTTELQTLSVGSKGLSVRGEGRFDVPLSWDAPVNSDTGAFLRLRGGHDSWDQKRWGGGAAILGMRYHSSAFIAELSVQITQSPQQLTKDIRSASDRWGSPDHD